jgi:hypothetical protein
VDFGQPEVKTSFKNVVQNPLIDLFTGESVIELKIQDQRRSWNRAGDGFGQCMFAKMIKGRQADHSSPLQKLRGDEHAV